MSRFWAQVRVVAYRDFMAIAGTPAFLLFLFAPFFMLALGALGGGGAAHLALSSANKARIAILLNPEDAPFIRAADRRLRTITEQEFGPPRLIIIPSHGPADAEVARAMLAQTDSGYEAVLYGPLQTPTILADARRNARYLAALAEQTQRDRLTGVPPQRELSKATIILKQATNGTARMQQGVASAAVFVIFFLTLLLAGQTVGTFAEEKSNKVIEILAAAVPLEAVFMGKLVGLFGIALLFIGFWGGLAAAGASILAASPIAAQLPVMTVAMGLPAFFGLGFVYFSLAFFLLGAIFLTVGSQASSVREIQLLSLPVTFVQVGMFVLSSSAASSPGSTIAYVAEIFPLSSPFAMAARAATDDSLWPHLLAIAWQLLWLAIVIRLGTILFRRGVLKSGPALRFWSRTNRS